MKSTNGLGFTLLELLICIVIIAILTLISLAMILEAGEKAKNSAVYANAAAAASVIAYKLTLDPLPADELANQVVEQLNNPDGEPDTADELKSPFDADYDAFTDDEVAEAG